MSIKTQIGEIIENLIARESTDVGVYDVEITTRDNYHCFGTKQSFIDSDGDLRIVVSLEVEDLENLFDTVTILDSFTEDELKTYIESNYDGWFGE